MSVKSVSGAQGSVPAQTTQGIREENGKMVVTFGGKKYTLTKKQAEQYNEVLYSIMKFCIMLIMSETELIL